MAPSSLSLTSFEAIRQVDSAGAEYRYARDLCPVLGYAKRENFLSTLQKAQGAVEANTYTVADHFLGVRKMVALGSGSQREILDYKLSRLACYHIAMCGDPKKLPIAQAQLYFAHQTRKQELHAQYLHDKQRYEERLKYTETDKEFSSAMYRRGLQGHHIAMVKAEGQKTFYNKTPEEMRHKYGIKDKHTPLVNKAPQILITAQSLANQISAHNVASDPSLRTEADVTQEHVTNTKAVRSTLISRGIVPEIMPPEEDTDIIKKKLEGYEQQYVG